MPSPFEILGVPPRFDLDEADLHRRYIAASAATHPDRFVDAVEQADAAERAALINDAYRMLAGPESRANALLAALGGPAKEDDKELPAGLLMQMMEAREELEDSVRSGEQSAIDRLAAWAAEQRATHLKRIAELFRNAETTPPAERSPALKDVRRELNALRYFERMIEQQPS